MFSFLSNWQQTFRSSDRDSDDVSSLNRSLDFPWPVTESFRKDKNESVPRFLESAGKRKKENLHNLRTTLLKATYTKHASMSAPAEIVPLDNDDVPYGRPQRPPTAYHDDPTVSADVTHLYANGILNPGLYANHQHAHAHQTSHDDDDDDQHEIYHSPFVHSDGDDFFQGPHPHQTGAPTPTPRWGGLKLHTVSPFSKSTLRVDGLVFPQPPDTSPYHNLSLPIPVGLFTPSLQPGTPPLPTVNTDVYNHAYDFPLAHQLSPIAEQDYFSPISVRGLAASASPGADSALNFGIWSGDEKTTAEDDKGKDKERERECERGSTRTRSRRAGSVGSVKAPAMTKSGSLSMREGAPTSNPSPSGSTIGSEITRPSPIYASPFITRHLNRTISQTSSNKSESPLQAQFQLPLSPPQPPTPPVPAAAPPVTQPQPQGATQSNGSPIVSRVTSQLSIDLSTPRLSTATITPANVFLKLSGPDTSVITTGSTGSVSTPTSAASTTTGTMHTPKSALPAPTPTSPTSGATGIQTPVPAITILPYIPPLDLRPFFPGPSLKLSPESEVPRLRPPKKRGGQQRLSVIRGSGIQSGLEYEEDVANEEDEGGGYDIESLHAESFVTATTNSNKDDGENEKTIEKGVELSILAKAKTPSVHSTRTHTSQLPSITLSHSASGNSTGDSFILRRWDRATLGLSLSPTMFRERKHPFFSSNSSFISNLTPGFWAFWLGFLFPVLWFVGGWHFTNLGEQPPKSTIWEWYFWRLSDGWWKGGLGERWCVGMKKGGRSIEGFKNRKGSNGQQQQIQIQLQEGLQRRIPRPRTKSRFHSQLRSGKVFPALPQWVAEKQTSDDGRMRLNDPKRSLKGISFGYPFIPRPPYSSQGSSTLSSSTPPASSLATVRRVLIWIEKANRVLDQLYGVKLREVRGRPESGRRMFDPWIQRCRYAFCWIMLLVAIGLCTTSAYLIAVNTRKV